MILMNFNDLIKTSVRSITKNKGRTLLTSLGIIIGVTSVILLKSIGTGLENFVTGQFESLGSNLLYVLPGKVFKDDGGFANGNSFFNTRFSQKDVNSLKRNLENASSVIPSVQIDGRIKYRQVEKSISLFASTAEYGRARNSIPSEGNGRWFTNEEDSKRSAVVVLGFKVANDLFPNSSPLGKSINANGKTLKVIGVVDKKGGGGGFGGPDFDDAAYIPLQVGFAIAGNEDIQTILIQAKSNDTVNKVKREAEKILGEKYDKDAFSVVDQSQILSSINSIIGTLTIALSGIAAISLVVGGIGIMNIMLVTVTERTREIGLRKAVGGTPNTILVQFLIEAIILSCIGGITGIILGFLGTLAIKQFFPAQVTLDSIMLAFFVSVGVGVIFGVAPARKASKLSPIEALRYE